MEQDKFLEWVDKQLFEAGMNVSYHQTMAWWWGAANIALIAAALVGGGVCIYLSTQKKFADHSLKGSIISLVFMGICLLIPAGQYAADYKILAQRWTGVKSDVEALEIEAEAGITNKVEIATHKEQIRKKIGAIEEDEPSPINWLLIRCWREQAERFYGEGIDTIQEIEAYRKEHGLPPLNGTEGLPPGANV